MTLRAVALSAALAAVTTALPVLPARAEPPVDAAVNRYYYTVTASYQNAPENLWEIAERFLGDANRAGEILELNAGRVQPDGGRLANPNRLVEGWHVVLPWDAVGAELEQGPLPSSAARTSQCKWGDAVPEAASWGQSLLTPSRAWTVANGYGVTVAIIGSGVDGSAPELSGRVLTGTDVAAGTGRGDDSCTGSGTALAGITAGDDGSGGESFGVAPGARLVPVKAGTGKLTPRLAATAVDVATSAGAQVVLIGAQVDAANPVVSAAITDAIARDVVVVVPATVSATAADGLLRVGATGEDGQRADAAGTDAVDLLAPGAGVASIGVAGDGPEFAAAFVAGTVALVRSAHPELRAAEVTRQVRDTAAEGLVSPAGAVTAPLPAGIGVDAAAAPVPQSRLGTLGTVLIGVAIGLVVLLLAFLVPQLLKRRRTA
ncbi:S8 family serine peptidase [Actinoplanes rectilineatus]|uniref:S8 family serine peptidase n=1 Tax=Actinoplanes rectilineatus TaxID=113571 RepID=UPI000697EABC|nr:S8 family serine peptidase [Actinoplanes rectilineatus]